jgi:hypothetical protein
LRFRKFTGWLRRPLHLLIALFLVANMYGAVSATTVWASDSKRLMADQIISIYREEKYFAKIFELAKKRAAAEQKKIYKEIFPRMEQEAMYRQLGDRIYAGYSAEELQIYLTFANTDEGRSIIRKQAEMGVIMQEIFTDHMLKAMTPKQK